MAANSTPLFPANIKDGVVSITAANTKSDGSGTIGTDIFKLLTAGANGALVRVTSFFITATTPNSTTAATVFRFFKSTKSSGATVGGTDTWPIGEFQLASYSADQSTSAQPIRSGPCNFFLGPDETLLVTSHIVPAANTQHMASAEWSDF